MNGSFPRRSSRLLAKETVMLAICWLVKAERQNLGDKVTKVMVCE